MLDEPEVGPNGKPLDLCWEALVRETAANPAFERGKLNAALKAIRAAAFSEGLYEEQAVATEIELRAQAYRDSPKFGHCCLTPSSLAANWFRVMVSSVSGSAVGAQQQAFQQARNQP